MRRYVHGLAILIRAYRMQREKKHGRGAPTRREALFFAQVARWIAAQQHRPDLNPYRSRIHQ